MVVKGKTKSGIKFQLDSNIKKDAKFLFLWTKMQYSDDLVLQNKYFWDFLTFIFGSDDKVEIFLDSVRDAHNGVCDDKTVGAELKEIMASLDVKNS